MLKNLDKTKALTCETHILSEVDENNTKHLCVVSKSIDALKEYAENRDLDTTEEIQWVSYPFEIQGMRKGILVYIIERKMVIE